MAHQLKVLAPEGIDEKVDSCYKFVEKFRTIASSGSVFSSDHFNELVSMLPVQEFQINEDAEMTSGKSDKDETEPNIDLPWIRKTKSRPDRSRSPPPGETTRAAAAATAEGKRPS